MMDIVARALILNTISLYGVNFESVSGKFQKSQKHKLDILDLTVLRANGKKMGCALFFALDCNPLLVDISASTDISIQILIMGSVKKSIMIESLDV